MLSTFSTMYLSLITNGKKLLVFKKDCGYFMSVTLTSLGDHRGQKPGLFVLPSKLRISYRLVIYQMNE